jgi:hypothetical protein
VRYRDTKENTIVSVTDEFISYRTNDAGGDATIRVPSSPATAWFVNQRLDTLDLIHDGWLQAKIDGEFYDRAAYRMDMAIEQRALDRILGLNQTYTPVNGPSGSAIRDDDDFM